jgi:hypothetical protein
MRKDSLIRFSAVGLALVTAALVIFAIINWQKESQYSTPDDGVWWKEDANGLVAKGLSPDGPGAKAGVKIGDRLLRVNSQPKEKTVKNIVELEKLLYRAGVYSRATYLLDRQGVNIEVSPVIPVPVDNSMKVGQRLIALNWILCSVPPLDSAQIHSLLCFLPGVVCSLLVSLHRQAEHV